MSTHRPMEGIRILDLADHTFVPAASAVLSDWGAEVIKVEHITRGDAARGLASTGMAIFAGGTPIGAPLVGWVANAFGPRWALGVAAASGIVAAVWAVLWLMRTRDLRFGWDRQEHRIAVRYRGDGRDRELATTEIAVVEVETQRS